MTNCSNLYFLSTLACQLADCLSKDDLSVLATELTTLGDMLAVLLAKQAACEKE